MRSPYDLLMTQQTTPVTSTHPAPRAVLFWRPDSDESHVQPSVEGAALFLGVPVSSVIRAIESGDLLGEWFVDWQASSPTPAPATQPR